jgi:hypothetical protein
VASKYLSSWEQIHDHVSKGYRQITRHGYEGLAAYARLYSPKLAAAFLLVAAHYDDYARHEDEEAEREKLGR